MLYGNKQTQSYLMLTYGIIRERSFEEVKVRSVCVHQHDHQKYIKGNSKDGVGVLLL